MTPTDDGRIRHSQYEFSNRRLPLRMGKGISDGSSINVIVSALRQKEDLGYFASEAAGERLGFQSVLDYYRRIENWAGAVDPLRRGKGGLVYVVQPDTPQPIAQALIEAARTAGIPVFGSLNGEMMNSTGASIAAMLSCGNSVYRHWVCLLMWPKTLKPSRAG